MKQKIITAALMQLIKVLTGSQLLQRIKELVLIYWNDDVPGTKKKQLVTESMAELNDELGDIARELASWIMSTAIDVIHAYLINRPELTR